ncbi:MAG: hypothetical protein WCO56_27545 [Verrucomicrobiota bacterium]
MRIHTIVCWQRGHPVAPDYRKFSHSIRASSCWLAIFLAWSISPTASAAGFTRPGKVTFSNGESVEGKVSQTPGSVLQMHIDGKQIRTTTIDKVREIRFAALEEKMERHWRFAEAGQTRKEFWGKPYLTRTLMTTLVLSNGEKITGHLYTTVFYLEHEDSDKVEKVIVKAKATGKDGEGADSLRYPTLISFSDVPTEMEETIKFRINHEIIGDKTEVAAATWGALMPFTAKKTSTPNVYSMTSPLGNDVFLAARVGDRIVAGWPSAKDEKFFTMIKTNLVINEDFYDDRKLLGVYYDKKASDIYSITMMHRVGKTTLDAEKSQPWRLVVQRWKYDEESQQVLLGGRGYFFRGILKKGDTPPPVELSPKLWKLTKSGEEWVAGTGPEAK